MAWIQSISELKTIKNSLYNIASRLLLSPTKDIKDACDKLSLVERGKIDSILDERANLEPSDERYINIEVFKNFLKTIDRNIIYTEAYGVETQGNLSTVELDYTVEYIIYTSNKIVNNPDTNQSWKTPKSMLAHYPCVKIVDTSHLDFSGCTDLTSLVRGCKYIEDLNFGDFSDATRAAAIFQDCTRLKNIEIGNISNVTMMYAGGATANTLSTVRFVTNCTSLENFKCNGHLMKMPLPFDTCPNLNEQSIRNIVDALWDFSADGIDVDADSYTPMPVKFHEDVLERLYNMQDVDDIMTIAYEKGWEIQ